MAIVQFRRYEALFESQVNVSLTVNELRLMVNSMRALEYLSEVDGEPYLDFEGRALKEKLERQYLDASSFPSAGVL